MTETTIDHNNRLADLADRIRDADAGMRRCALEKGGVEFIPENGDGAGVRLRKGSDHGG